MKMSEVQEKEEEQFGFPEICCDDCHWFKFAISLKKDI